jgi:hypothetical protein
VAWFEIEAYTSSATPGVIYTGDQSASFGSGQSSSTQWVVGGSGYPEVYRPGKSSLSLSYASILAAAQKAGLQITELQTVNGCNNLDACVLPPDLATGVYKTTSHNMTISGAFTVGANKNIIILVDGASAIRAPITVPTGSTLFYATRDYLIIDKTLGQTPSCNGTNDVEGFFSSGNSIFVEGNNNCSVGADKQLRIGGTMIVNANLQGGSFSNNRDLCAQNPQYPSVLLSERADFILNAPNILKRRNLTYQETAP